MPVLGALARGCPRGLSAAVSQLLRQLPLSLQPALQPRLLLPLPGSCLCGLLVGALALGVWKQAAELSLVAGDAFCSVCLQGHKTGRPERDEGANYSARNAWRER